MRQRFVSKVSVHTVLLSPPLPLTTHTHSHLFNINSVVYGDVREGGAQGCG